MPRVIEIVLCSAALFVLSPLLLIIAIGVKLTSRGPVLFKGPRVGMHGRKFDILKFRTMFETRESYEGPHVTAKGDVRITRFGHFLRSTKLNELPQLMNIIRGDMSITGPRPEHPSFVMNWTDTERELILSVRPGLTSLATLRYRNEESLLQESTLISQYEIIARDKRALDIAYVRRKSLIVDLDIIILTLLVLLRVNRAEHAGRALDGPMNTFKAQLLWLGVDLMTSGIAYLSLMWIFDLGAQEMTSYLALALIVNFLIAGVGGAPWFKNSKWTRATALQFASYAVFAVSGFAILVASLGLLRGSFLYPLDLAVPTYYLIMWFISRFLARIGHDIYRILYRNTAPTRIMLIGAGVIGETISWILQDPRVTDRIKPVGFLDDDANKWGKRINSLLVVGSLSDMSRVCEDLDVDVILFATDRFSPEYESRLTEEADRIEIKVWHWKSLLNSLVELRDREQVHEYRSIA